MKPTRQERALKACIEYDTLMKRIKELSHGIRDAIGQCPIFNDPNAIPDARGHYPTHLHQALAAHDEDGMFHPIRVWLDEDEKREILDQCSHCSMAYEFIQQRRAAKKRLGIIKRSIRSIGRSNNHE